MHNLHTGTNATMHIAGHKQNTARGIC